MCGGKEGGRGDGNGGGERGWGEGMGGGQTTNKRGMFEDTEMVKLGEEGKKKSASQLKQSKCVLQ